MESLAPEHIAHRWVLDKGEVALISVFGDDQLIADTARVSYRKGTKQVSSDKQLIRYLLRNKHTSPFEHACARFYIKAPLFVVQQLLRHRTFKFNQSSARYSEMLNEAYVPAPEHVTTQDAKNRQARTDEKVKHAHHVSEQMRDGQEWAFKDYSSFLDQGVARELARINLPHGTYSELIVTADIHNLMHFLALRLHPHAQYEIRVFAEAMKDMVKGVFPHTFEAWEDCVLNSFILTGKMQEVLGDLISSYKSSSLDNTWLSCLQETCSRYEWVSKSEKDQFMSWCSSRLNIK